MVSGRTRLIAHVGHPTEGFRSPAIYNPWFAHVGCDALVVPMGVPAEDRESGLRAIFRFTNVIGALITMPHKIGVVGLLDTASPAVDIAGACNAVRIAADGRLHGDMFDGEGFARAVLSAGRPIRGRSAFLAGCGGVGSAIAAALAAHGLARLTLHDVDGTLRDRLSARLRRHHPALAIRHASDAPGHDIVINATPLGMAADDPPPFALDSVEADALVGDVVLKPRDTALVAAARGRGHRVVVGDDMLFEQIPAYLAFFGLPVADAATLRAIAAT